MPDYNLGTTISRNVPSPFNGCIGLSGDNLNGQYRNLKVTDKDGNILFNITPGEWYKFRIEFKGSNDLICYINDEKVLEQEVHPLNKIHAVSGYDKESGFGKDFQYTFVPNSFTIMRIKTSEN